MTYALRGARRDAPGALAARMPQVNAVITLIAPTFTGVPVHEPVYNYRGHHLVPTTQRHRRQARISEGPR